MTEGKFLALDFETSSADPLTTTPVEVGYMVLDDELNVLASAQTPIRAGEEVLAEIMGNPDLVRMHSESGLLQELTGDRADSFPDIAEVERGIVTMIDTYAGEEKLTILGSGVGRFDHLIIRRLMPAVAERLNYWEYDPSSLRRLFKHFTGLDLYNPGRAKRHRPLDDLDDDIQLLRHFASFVRGHALPQDVGDRQTRVLAGIAVLEASMSFAAMPTPEGDIAYTADELEAIQALFNNQLIPGPAYGLMTVAGRLVQRLAEATGEEPEAVIEDLRRAALSNDL